MEVEIEKSVCQPLETGPAKVEYGQKRAVMYDFRKSGCFKQTIFFNATLFRDRGAGGAGGVSAPPIILGKINKLSFRQRT